MPPDTWGINVAAALDNFPDGLLIQIPAWDVMNLGDTVDVRLNSAVVTSGYIVDDSQKGQTMTLFIAPGRLNTSYFTLDYQVKRIGSSFPEPSLSTKIYIKLERPGGKDQNGDIPGHSELHMRIPDDILNGGVDAETENVPITILPYPYIAEGDRICLSWGGEFVWETVTAVQVSDPDNNPIVVVVDKDTLDKWDTGEEGLAVAFEVRDVVENRSEDWSAAERIVVDTGSSRLLAPLIDEAFNNVLDMDALADTDPVTAQVVVMGKDFAVGDQIEIRLRGTTDDSEVVDTTYPLVRIESLNKVIDIPLPSADVRPLVNTQAVFSYRLVKADGSGDLFSKGQFVSVIGEATQLAAPIALDAIAGTLDPALPRTQVQIPWDDSMTAGQAIKLQWFGTRPGSASVYLPDLGLHLITTGEEQAKAPIPIPVEGVHLRAIEGGTLDLYYLLLRDTDAREVVSRESLHAELLNIGEPRAELPKPDVEGEQDGVLDPEQVPAGTRLIVRRYAGQTSGDDVHYVWKGSSTGTHTDYVKLNAITDKYDVPFSIGFDLIKGNEGGTVQASYWVKRVGGGTSASEILTIRIGAAMNLAAPRVKQASGATPNQQLNPVAAKDALTVVVPDYGIQPGDKVSVTWSGTAGAGSHTTPVQTLPGSREIPLPVSVLAFNLDRSVTVTYTVTRDGSEGPASAPLTLNVQAMPATSLAMPLIPQAAQGGLGRELDLTSFTGNARVTCAPWPLIAAGQRVWLRAEGIAQNGGGVHIITLYTASAVNSSEVSAGLVTDLLRSELVQLRDGSELKVILQVTFNRSASQDETVTFPLRIYTVKAVELIDPTIDSVKDPQNTEIPNGVKTSATTITLIGKASNNEQVEIFDGATSKGTAPVDAYGEWRKQVTGLSVTRHSFTAKGLYGSHPVSAERTLTVVPGMEFETSPVQLNGKIYIVRGVFDYYPGLKEGAFIQRTASYGTLPYSYHSSDDRVAMVDTMGMVTARGNGEAHITATDANGLYKTYSVTVTGVISCIRVDYGIKRDMEAAATSIGGRLPSIAEIRELSESYTTPPHPFGTYETGWVSDLYMPGMYDQFFDFQRGEVFLRTVPATGERSFNCFALVLP
ncbi:hypothetical protein ACJ6X8_23555 [Pseudomonas alvandae]|uniref:hypothetical protein n=1 Tax=Pseudomonas TaxID=286 RepID=UPI003899AF80